MSEKQPVRSLNVWLVQADYDKLRELATEEYRTPRDQAGLLLRDAIRERHARLHSAEREPS